MNFEKSTQAQYWMYNETSLVECRTAACEIQSTVPKTPGSGAAVRARKHASGYIKNRRDVIRHNSSLPCSRTSRMSPDDQETLVQFHAHQIQRLVGPNAVLHELRRSVSALSTAIMLFRRFYLSNSVIDFHPRNIAAASALLSVKVECEKDLEVCGIFRLIFV
jgi:hypothetical protein